MPYGRQVLGTFGEPIRVLANTNNANYVPIGIQIDWTTVTALGAPTTYVNGDVYPVGAKVLRYGQVMCKITSVVNGSTIGMYGPYDPAATDGRQTLTRGSCYILDTTFSQYAPVGLTTKDTDHVGAIEGGLVWLARIIQSGVATHTLALGPTLAELQAAFPLLRFAQ